MAVQTHVKVTLDREHNANRTSERVTRVLQSANMVRGARTYDHSSCLLTHEGQSGVDSKRAIFHFYFERDKMPQITMGDCDLCQLQSVWCRVVLCGDSKMRLFVCSECEMRLE